MFKTLSIVFGIIAGIIGAIGFIPLLGWLNWIVIPLAFVGFLMGLIAKNSTGKTLNVVIIIYAFLRLILGGGLL